MQYYNLSQSSIFELKKKKKILFREGGESRITISINEARQSCKNPAIFRFQQVHRSVDDQVRQVQIFLKLE